MPPKQPQDHKAKTSQDLDELDEYFSFDHDGKTYVMPNKTLDILTVGFVRKNRRRDETDFVFTCIEELAGEDKHGEEIIKIIDDMPREEFKEFQKSFTEHLGAALGE